jgi:hypothetical protein
MGVLFCMRFTGTGLMVHGPTGVSQCLREQDDKHRSDIDQTEETGTKIVASS